MEFGGTCQLELADFFFIAMVYMRQSGIMLDEIQYKRDN